LSSVKVSSNKMKIEVAYFCRFVVTLRHVNIERGAIILCLRSPHRNEVRYFMSVIYETRQKYSMFVIVTVSVNNYFQFIVT
jgi:hypothetical protein